MIVSLILALSLAAPPSQVLGTETNVPSHATAKPALAFTSDPGRPEGEIYFRKNDATLSNKDEIEIQNILMLSKQYRFYSFTIIGRSERFGSAADALQLSHARALSVARALTQAGVPTSALNISWIGQTDPAVLDSANHQGGTLDDRVTVSLFP